ncbi:hypothetical protein YYE_04911 [Plasmodium vinckei vinckei]|uniref:PIR protein CIR protein n=1 Tax=Plasmodium vinckei vinckei TaxID=54757 RepID=A0A081I985_PLAVN|nr:hypothetical protein YYE_04911 [Plasmodium vinckei vinckei]
MSMDVCKIFLKVDILFENGKLNLKKVNKKYRQYCPINIEGAYKCEDDIKGISTLSMHLFNELYKRSLDIQKRENNDNEYVEYVMMWLGFRLFQEKNYLSSTIMDFYKNNILNSHIFYTFDEKIRIKKHLLHANLEYMSRLYQLFQEICYITLKYPKVNPNVIEINKDSTRFYNKHVSLYRDINECESYLNLLNNLETLYGNLKKSIIKNKGNRHLKGMINVNFKNLSPTRKANKKSTIGFECPKCKKINSKAEEKIRKRKPIAPKPVDPISSPAAPSFPPQPQQPQSIPVPASPEKHKEGKPSQQAEQHPPSSLPPVQPPVLTTTIQKGSSDPQGVINGPEGQLQNQDNSLKQQEDSGNMQLQNIFNIFKSTFETYRSPFYNTYTDIGNNLYKKASSALENAYDKSRKFASDTINYLNEHLNKALEKVPPSKENESEPPHSLPKNKKQEPQNIQTPIPGGQSNGDPQEPLSIQKDGSPNSKQINPSDSPSGKQPQPSVDPSSKTSSLNIEKGNTGINAEEKAPQLVSSIDIFKGYNRPEIVVTVLLIPIILGIMYKYFSSGWRKEMNRKKNMKKVINSIGGKRPVQIIIKSVAMKKMETSVINPISGGKKSLLNIYKHMQADPAPFINLFFLLIFFVYKRKHNSLELSI